MKKSRKSNKHTYHLPQNVGKLSINIKKGHFVNLTNNDLQRITSLFGNMLYGITTELPYIRRTILDFIEMSMEFLPIKVSNKSDKHLIDMAGAMFDKGDYVNSLFIYELVVSKILKNNKSDNIKQLFSYLKDNKDKIFELIALLNSISYINSKLKCNLEESKEVSLYLFDYLSNNFNESDFEVISLKAAVSDTIGSIYLNEEKVENIKQALKFLQIANSYDNIILESDYYDPISFRLTLYKLGEAYLKLGESFFYNEKVTDYHADIHQYLNEAISCFEGIDILKKPVIQEEDFISYELKEVLNLSAKGILKAKGMLMILKE